MTEQQFEQLKQRLDASATQSPASLDDTILAKAEVVAEQNQNQEIVSNTRSEKTSWLLNFFQTTFAQSAFVSIALTAAVFATLALLIKPAHQEESTITFESNKIEFDLVHESTNGLNGLQNDHMKTKVLIPTIEMPQTQQGRDQILAQMPLPNVQVLLDEMDFAAQHERELTHSVISLAMEDIRVMIDNNNLNGARVRYARLKESCASCPLPSSLEALLIVTSQEST